MSDNPWDISTYLLIDSSYTDSENKTGMFSIELISQATGNVAERNGYECGTEELEHRVVEPQITIRKFWPPRIHKKLSEKKKLVTHRRIILANPRTNSASSIVYEVISDQIGEMYFRRDKGSERESERLMVDLCQELLRLETEKIYGAE
jgi:hypothetical protein